MEGDELWYVGRKRTKGLYDIWYRVECWMCWCWVREFAAIDTVGAGNGGEPIDFGGHIL